ncbi:MAG: glycosyltransferase [bacterium]|nr:glycosyltransferase [bacterium]
MKISVVVISYNQRAFIERLTTQLLDQDFAATDYEIVIVECCSNDGTPDWLADFRDARVVALPLGYKCNRSHGRNRGIEAARGEIVIMIDGDHTIQRAFLSVHWRAHAKLQCAIVGKSDFVDHPEYRALNAYLNGGGAAKLPLEAPLPGRYCLTPNCSVPKRVLVAIGLFDEAFDKWGGEDLDLGLRIEDADVPIFAEPNALALHHHHRPIRSFLRTSGSTVAMVFRSS